MRTASQRKSAQAPRQFAVFAAVGLLNTCVDAGVFLVLAALCHVAASVAQVISYSCGMVNSFAWNRGVTFRAGALRIGEIVRFLAVNGASLILSFAAMRVFTRADWPLFAAKAIVTLGTLALNFAGSKWWVWRDVGGQANVALRSVEGSGARRR
ncbi:GtrA family protein [Alicyclobacillus sendaiensis]|uniref:GtrA family protein n=1 Tax=Alicyclobacillus sendaiensis PA2 TaxID=3029425 RepID=A0ABT6XYE5_ALISE|nr:GtrA family protein [Alicyclobacillus sendaiensis]MDI9260110.1 GtrA family protein [Alicyclobacillus sendaiensis PA2]